jgi:branched-chain amino acid aminotransferase
MPSTNIRPPYAGRSSASVAVRGEAGAVTEVHVALNPNPLADDERAAVLAAPVFGEVFTDHMVTMRFAEGTWGPLELQPFGPLALSPATLALHYGQSVFEALKAYAMPDGEPALFRPDRNAARLGESARRIAMPELPDGAFELACALLVEADRDWVSRDDGAALYVRPYLFGSEPHLSVRPANEYLFVVIASPAANYFGAQLSAITVGVEAADVRATPGGTGAVKFAGNYAAGFAAHGRVGAAGHDQVLWLDAVEHRWIEELNAMNVVFVWSRDGRTVVTTPPLTGTILEGVTRDSLLALAAEEPLVDEVRVEPTSIDMLRSGVADGWLVEMFACGTAAVIAPIGVVAEGDAHLKVGTGEPGPVTTALRRRLLDVQQGLAPGPDGWLVRAADVLAAAGVVLPSG